MNDRPKSMVIVLVYAAAILGTFLLMGIMVRAVRSYTQPAPLGTARIEERRKALAEVNAQAHDQLETYGWIDQGKGLVRIPIAQAMDLLIKQAQNPATARSNLLARVEKANPPPPPKAPEKPSQFE